MDLITKYSPIAIAQEGQLSQANSPAAHLQSMREFRRLNHTKIGLSVLINCSLTHRELICNFTLLRNNVPLRLSIRCQRMLICRLVNHINSRVPLGSMKVDPLLGTICYSVVVIVNAHQPTVRSNRSLVDRYIGLFECYLSQIENALLTFQRNNETEVRLQNIKLCLKQALRCRSVTQLKLHRAQKGEKSTVTTADPHYLPIEVFVKYLVQPQPEIGSTNEKTNILNEIRFLTDKMRWTTINDSNVSIISASVVQFCYKSESEERSNDTIKRMMVMKMAKQGSEHKIKHEKLILAKIKDDTCIYLPKFYYSRQRPDYDNAIFTEFSKYSSLNSFLKNTYLYCSLPTKLYLLCSAAMGLLLLHTKNIYHLDFKPHNLLVGAALSLRVNDFGEAFHSQLCGVNYKPGFTLMYSSPEVCSGSGPFTASSDVYSLGITIFEVVFQQLPFIIHHKNGVGSHDAIPTICSQRLAQIGPLTLMTCLLELCLRCMHPHPNHRPHLQWIIVVLRESFEHVKSIF